MLNLEVWFANYELWIWNCKWWTVNYTLWTLICSLCVVNWETFLAKSGLRRNPSWKCPEASWAVLEASWAVLSRLGSALETSWRLQNQSKIDLGALVQWWPRVYIQEFLTIFKEKPVSQGLESIGSRVTSHFWWILGVQGCQNETKFDPKLIQKHDIK